MFTPDAIIDTVQTGKKEVVKTFVKNEAISEALIKFVDAQTAYTKDAFKASQNAATVVASEINKSVKEAAKFDFVKAAEDFSKSFTAKK